MNYGEILTAIRARFPKDQYALLTEVRNTTGWSKAAIRSADVIVMGLWPSRGLDVHGFEIKVSRSDWFRELKNPAKADPIFRYCDHWWLVVGDEGIVKDGELPKTWGLLAPKEESRDTLAVKVQAPLLPKPKVLDRLFVASMLRRAQEESASAEQIETATRKVREEYEKDIDARVEAALRGRDRALSKVSELERAIGIEIFNGWHPPKKVGKVLKFLLEHDPLDTIRHVADMLEEAAARARAQSKAMEEAAPCQK